MNFAEALTALIDQQVAHNEVYYERLPEEFPAPTRDEVAACSENIRISASVMGDLNGDMLYKDPDVEYGVFDNMREYGITLTVAGWTFGVYEHRNSDQIIVNGCRTAELRPYGPYALDGDKYDYLASFPFRKYDKAREALEDMIHQVRANPDVERWDLKKVREVK